MRKGSQPSVNYSTCLSTVALANRDGTTRELFIPKVILLTVGNSGMVAGKTSFSSVVSSSLFTNSTLFFHAGILRISCPFAVRDLSPSQRALYYSFVPLAPLVPSNTLIKLTCTTEWRYAVTRGSGKPYVTAGP